jgi:hypothetical protein
MPLKSKVKGIKVSARDAETGSVVLSQSSVFSERFGKETTAEDSSSKRKPSSNIQYFTKPWRIVKHMKEQHSQSMKST